MRAREALSAVLLLAAPACAAPAILPWSAGPGPVPAAAEVERADRDVRWEESREQDFREGPAPYLLSRDRFTIGAWGWGVRDSSGASNGLVDAVGGRFEWTRFDPRSQDGAVAVSGILVEAMGGSLELEGDAGDEVNRAAVAGIWWTTGSVRGVRADKSGEFEGFDLRTDLLLGARVLRFVDDDTGQGSLLDGDRNRFSGVELSIGARTEVSPVPGAVLFAWGDVGALTSVSAQLSVGLRVELVRSLELEVGWRFFSAAGGELFDSNSFNWTGPWAGLTFSF